MTTWNDIKTRLRPFMPADEMRRILALGPRNERPVPVVDGTAATIRLYDPIDDWGGWWGISAKELAVVLDQLPKDVDTINLRVNSPGGLVFEGWTIANMLRHHSAKVVAHVDGLAASIASVIVAVAADEVVMGAGTQLMIHDVWNVIAGDAADLRSEADLLDRLSDQIAAAYARRAGGTAEEWRDRMRVETWFSPDEAVAIGLADRALEPSTASNRAGDPPADTTKVDASQGVDGTAAVGASQGDDGAPTNEGADRPARLNAERLALLDI